jgi:hypothetical protein
MSVQSFNLTSSQLILCKEFIKYAQDEGFPPTIRWNQNYTFKGICKRNKSVYKCVALGVVIKRFNFISNPDTPEKVRVPTIYLSGFPDWVVQPIVRKTDRKIAVELIRDMLECDVKCDLHYLNVGWWNENPVMFDW